MNYANEYAWEGENKEYLYIDNGKEIYITKRLMKKIAEDYEIIKKKDKQYEKMLYVCK